MDRDTDRKAGSIEVEGMEVSDRVELPLFAACMSGDVVNDKWDVLDDENDQNAIMATIKTEATDSIVIFAE